MKKTHVISLVVILGIGLVFLFSNNTEEEVNMDSSDVSNQEVEVAEEAELNDESDVSEDDSELDVDAEVSVTEHNLTVDSFSYGYSMEEIKVKEGDTVTINLTNSNGFHDWVVDEFDAATEKISAGGETSVTFVASKKGTFEFYCSVGNHRAQGMVGNLIVE